MIPQNTIQEIIDTARIEEVIGDFVQLRKSGSNFKALSPFTTEKTPSFYVSPGKQIFKCFSSGKGGNVVSFLMEHDKLSYPEALRTLADRYNIEIPEDKTETAESIQERNKRESLFAIMLFANKFFQNALNNTDDGKAIGLSYYKERGISTKSIEGFNLGYSPENNTALYDAAKAAQYNISYLEELGLVKNRNGQYRDFYRGRVIFPIHSISGKVIAFGGRTLSSDKKIPKYVNSPENELYNKSNVLYGIYQAKNAIIRKERCVLVEGYTDVISMHQNGVENVVASSGTALTEGQVRLIKRYTNKVTILYDGDKAGIKASLRGLDLFLKEGMFVKLALLPEGKDPDNFAQENSTEEIEDFLENKSQDFLQFKANVLQEESKNYPAQKAEAIKDIIQSISLIPDTVTRSLYIKECAQIMGLQEEVLIPTLNQELRKQAQKTLRVTEQEAKTLQNAPHQAPSQKVQEPTNVFYFLERELIRLLFNYGTLVFSIKEHSISVSDFILNTIEAEEISFQDPFLNTLLNELKSREPENYQALLHNEDQDICQFLTNLSYDKHELSPGWKTNKIHTKSESDFLEKVCSKTLYYYMLERILKEIDFIEQSLKEPHEDVLEHENLLRNKMRFDKAKGKFALAYNRTPILKH